MKPIGIVLLVIAIILVAAMIVLYFLGKKHKKKKNRMSNESRCAVTMLIIDKTNENERCRPSFTGNGTGKQTHQRANFQSSKKPKSD